MYQSNTIKHGNANYTKELEKWHINRLFPGERDDEEQNELEDEIDDEEEDELEIETSPAKKGTASKGRKRRALSHGGSQEGDGGNEREGSVEGPRKKAARLASLLCNDPEILQFLAEGDESNLKILQFVQLSPTLNISTDILFHYSCRPLPDLEYFIRRTKMADYNILSEIVRYIQTYIV